MWIENPARTYSSFDRSGVICLALASLFSLCAIAGLLLFKRPKRETYKNTHIFGYFMSLLAANAIQATGTVMNFMWVGYSSVMTGSFCGLQGAVKQLGNVATALWACMIAVHLFNLLFVRMAQRKWAFWTTFGVGWGSVIFIVILGPTAIQKPDWGPYFGPSGAWCWITDAYHPEQIFLEYFLEYLSAGISFVLYIVVLLRVRGNLIFAGGKWDFRRVPAGESWRPAFSRDLLDTALLNVAKMMVWYPIAYTFLLIPITLTRLLGWAGYSIPFGIVILTDIMFNLMGFVNVMLMLYLEQLFPDLAELPHFNIDGSNPDALKPGAEPFTLEQSMTEKYRRERGIYIPFPERAHFPSFTRKASTESNASNESWGNDIKDYV